MHLLDIEHVNVLGCKKKTKKMQKDWLIKNWPCIVRNSPINHFIGGVLVKSIIKSESLVLQVASQVNFLLGFMNHYYVLTGNGDDVQILHWQFYEDMEQTLSSRFCYRANLYKSIVKGVHTECNVKFRSEQYGMTH